MQVIRDTKYSYWIILYVDYPVFAFHLWFTQGKRIRFDEVSPRFHFTFATGILHTISCHSCDSVTMALAPVGAPALELLPPPAPVPAFGVGVAGHGISSQDW